MKIAVIGSASSSGYSDAAAEAARELGKVIAKRGYQLLYGPEVARTSLPAQAAASAFRQGGDTVAIAIGSARTHFFAPENARLIIYTEGGAGGARETVLINSADVVIAIGGGSGTLTEMCLAYMNTIPIVALAGSGGWSEKLSGEYLDSRNKFPIVSAASPSEAVDLSEQLFEKYRFEPSQSDRKFSGTSEKNEPVRS